MPNASGGLNKALAVNELFLQIGDEGALVVWYSAKEIDHKPVKDTDALQRVQVLHIENAAPVSAEDVATLLTEQTRRQEEAAGVARLEFGDNGNGEPSEVGE